MNKASGEDKRGPFPARYGMHLSRWPKVKLEHARRRARDIESIVQLWRSAAPITMDMVPSEDLTALHGIARVHSDPPLDEIALIFGDMLHSLRSGLDNLAWELAHIDGRKPRNERQLYFPICRTLESWERKKATLDTWPERSLDLVRDLQPFNQQIPLQSPLLWLEELNILEKHRQRLEVVPTGLDASATFNIALAEGTTLRFANKTELPAEFDGLEIMRVTISPPALEFFPEPIVCNPDLMVRLDAAEARLDILITALLQDVERLMDVATGTLPPETPRPLLGGAAAGQGEQVESNEDGFTPVKDVRVTHVGPL